jgi:hypothetical protein
MAGITTEGKRRNNNYINRLKRNVGSKIKNAIKIKKEKQKKPKRK